MNLMTILIVVLLCTAAGVGCNDPDASLPDPTIVTYEVGIEPREIAVADFNNDGRLDIAVANSGDGTLTILIGTKNGNLQHLMPAVPCGNEPGDVDAADFDNDGDIDLMVANHETSKITLLLNDGHAGFQPAKNSPFETGARPHLHGLATGDFNGDGWIDVAVESADTREVRVLFNSPGGLDTAKGILIGTLPYYRLGVSDVTGDGLADILIPGHGNNTVIVVTAKQDQLMISDWILKLSAQPWMVVGEDVNGDELNDIIAVVTNGVSVWLRDSNSFKEAPGSPFEIPGATGLATGDVDNDGIADIFIGPWEGNEVTILNGLTFNQRTVIACERPIGLAIADLNNDNLSELCIICPKENRLVIMNGR